MPHTHDHQLNIAGTAYEFYLIKDDEGKAMYQVIEEIPEYQPSLKHIQADWISGHGQYRLGERGRYFEGQAIDTTQTGKVFLGPEITQKYEGASGAFDSTPLGFFWGETAGKWLVWTAEEIYYWDTGNNYWVEATTTVANVNQMVEFNGVIYAAIQNADPPTTAYYFSTDGLTWTQTDITDDEGTATATGFLVSPNPDGTAENLWKFKTPNKLTRTTDGRTAGLGGVNYESNTYVGETANNIINIFLNGNKFYVGKEDGLYWLDSNGGVHAALPDELKVNHSTDNFKYVSNWQTSSYFSLQRGMGELTTSETYRPVGPLTDIDDIGKFGDIKGITSDRDWIYVAVDEGTNTHIYKGREVWTGSKLLWEWCPWVFLSTNACSAIRVCQHSTTDRRLWFGYGTHTGYVVLSDNPLADSAARFTTAGWVRMSYDYGSDPNYDKLWQSAVIEQTRYNSGGETAASAGETVELNYRDDNDLVSSSTALIAAYNTAGVVETNFTSAINSKRICFELWLASNTNTATPVVYLFQAKGVEKPTRIRIHEAYYAVGDKPSERVKTIRDALETARTSTTLVKFADLRFGQKTSGTTSGDYVWCVMEPGTPQVVEVMHEKGRQPELAIKVRLREVSFTIS